MIRLAFAGFRHAHIFALYEHAKVHAGVTIVGTWEENPADSLLGGKDIGISHESFDQLLEDCDAVAIGDCYGKRGALAIRALQAGRHVISDKPLCTSLAELDEIERLASGSGLKVGMMLDIRDSANLIGLRDAVSSGLIGEVQTVSVCGQHPLLPGSRPAWYFEEGMHGGTLNDIAIHAVDFIPWVTGIGFDGIVAARAWNAKATMAPHFLDCAQFMMRLANGGGVLGDVSYLAPDACGYSVPNYWRIVLHGMKGLLETSAAVPGVIFAGDTSPRPEVLPPVPARRGGYLEDFLADVAGSPSSDGLTTTSCLAASRLALNLEVAACP